MANQAAGRIVLSLCGAGLLAGCGEDGNFNLFEEKPNTEVTSGTNAPDSTQLVERDVEVPEVFQESDQGLWDGRPSLGGVWVAHPDVAEPERVMIRNEANGKFVVGALFKRERDNPGPVFQVSSDAAAALGILAGAPGQINVTALRRQEVPISGETPGEAFETAETDPEAFDAPETIETASLDDPGVIETPETAELNADVETGADGETIDISGVDLVAPVAGVASTVIDGATDGVVAGAGVLTAEMVAAVAGPKAEDVPVVIDTALLDAPNEAPGIETTTLDTGLAESTSPVFDTPLLDSPALGNEAEVLAAAALDAAGVLPIPDSALLPDASLSAAPALSTVTPAPAPVLSNVVPTAAPANPPVEPAPEPVVEEEVALVKPEVANDKDPEFTKRFIQIGLFNDEDTANRSGDRLRGLGILPVIKKDESTSTPRWRVLAGPSPSLQERTVLLAKVKALGYSDAYFVAQ